MEFVHVNEETFQAQVLQSALPVLVEFGAVWCRPCKLLEPELMRLGDEWKGRVSLAKVDVDQAPHLAEQYGVMSVPTVVLFKAGQAVERSNGIQSRDKLTSRFGVHISG